MNTTTVAPGKQRPAKKKSKSDATARPGSRGRPIRGVMEAGLRLNWEATVLMELITGRKALDETMPDERCHSVSWFRRVIITKENIVNSIEQTLDTQNEDTLESIIKEVEVSGHCTAREPFQRPDMCHAVNVLGPLVEQWKPSKHEEVEESYSHRMSLPEVLHRWQTGEGSSGTFDMWFSQTQSSIPNKPSWFSDTFDSSDCR
ncbi:hypothetical protein Tco_0887136 [Tanacetum coccineum]